MKNQVENYEAVHESCDSERVVRFINQNSLTERICNMIENGDLYGLYLDDTGSIVAKDIHGDIHENILD